MDVLISLLSNLIVCLCDADSRKVTSFMNLDQRLNTVVSELKKLADKRDDLKKEVDQIELDGFVSSKQVKGFIERVEAIEVEVSSIVECISNGRKCCCSCIPKGNCSSRYKMSTKIDIMLDEINGLKKDVESIDVVENGSVPPPVENIPNTPTVGLEFMLEKVHHLLVDDDIGSIGIYGMGGAGKTTLLKSINNEFLTKMHDFDVVIWVLVSKDYVAEKIQQAVGVRLGLTWVETEDPRSRAAKIYRMMMRKKFLVLLDDVWEGIDLLKIGIPLPDKNNKCKMIFTTRSMDVCSDMDAHRKLKHEFLREEESWKLFSDKVGGMEILKSPFIKPYVDIIIRKCGGLPLALITMGRAMSNKQTEEEWRYAVEVLDKSPAELRGMRGIFTLLKFSYDNLDNDTLRSCFLYFSLFPEDYSIEKEQLVEYWIGEGFLEGSHGRNAHIKGYNVIGELKVACLLEDGEAKTQVKMHDVVRCFALWVASDCEKNTNKYIVQASAGLVQAQGIETYWEKAEKISIFNNGITDLSVVPCCPNLSTLFLHQNPILNIIHDDFFQTMPALKVLDLSSTCITYIPSSIGKLKELRYLDLSYTMISTLPKDLGKLVNLRHLDLQRTHSLTNIPREAISGLTRLRSLNLYYSYGLWKVENLKDDQIGFTDLSALDQLTTLGITVTELATLRRLSGINTLLKCLQYLHITDCEGLTYLELVQETDDGELLRRLSVSECRDLIYLVIGEQARNRWLPSLEVLTLFNLPNLTKLWMNPVTDKCLRNLRSINIKHCHNLHNISWAFLLPKLEEIFLCFNDAMKEVVSEDATIEGGLTEFPSLQTLVLQDLPELRSICKSALALPSLQGIVVIGCPKLKKLPFRAQNVLTLPKVHGDKEWWDALEWDEETIKSSFVPHFIPHSSFHRA